MTIRAPYLSFRQVARAIPCHVMASRAMPGHIFASHTICLLSCRVMILRVMPRQDFSGKLPLDFLRKCQKYIHVLCQEYMLFVCVPLSIQPSLNTQQQGCAAEWRHTKGARPCCCVEPWLHTQLQTEKWHTLLAEDGLIFLTFLQDPSKFSRKILTRYDME